jgi:hypothetical protein
MLEEMIAKKQQLQESSLLCVLAIGPAAEFEKARSSNPFAGHFVCKPRRCVYLLSCVEAAYRFCLHKDKYNRNCLFCFEFGIYICLELERGNYFIK